MRSASTASIISTVTNHSKITGRIVTIGVLDIAGLVIACFAFVVIDHLQGGMLAIQCVMHSSTVTLMIARQFHQDENGLHEHFKEHPDHPYCEACGFCSETDIYEHYDNQHHPECSECDRVRQYARA